MLDLKSIEFKKSKLLKYWPLACVIIISALTATALFIIMKRSPNLWMHNFMGIFLCQLATLKLLHPKGFAEGFAKYDLIAMRNTKYALFYPLIELFLGLCFLAQVIPVAIYILTIAVFGLGAVGVIMALKKGMDVRCVCLGTILDVPLSTVSLIEDIGMVLMTAFLLFFM